jgi:hypothetical protein
VCDEFLDDEVGGDFVDGRSVDEADMSVAKHAFGRSSSYIVFYVGQERSVFFFIRELVAFHPGDVVEG